MSGGEERGRSMALRSKKKDADTDEAGCSDEAMLAETVTLASIRDTINETMVKAMSGLQTNISKQLTDINQKLEETAGKIEATLKRLGEAEQRIGEVETFGVEVQEVLTQMQKTQQELKSKITELEGHSRRNNIRIYGIKEGAEGTSMARFVENFIKTELGESTGLNELGIERAHRAAGSRPAETAPPRSTVVRFLKYTTKEKIISAAWRKKITLDGKRVFFDHDYATGVMEKRREYTTIKKALKEKGIRFHTPMTKMRVFLESGTVTYESADQAADDLRARGLPIPPRPEGGRREAPRPSPRWEKVKSSRRGAGGEYQQRIRDKLRGFNRLNETDNEDC